MRLTSQATAALATAVALTERDHALTQLAGMLDDGNLSCWALAGLVSERIRRFKATAWPRISTGGRPPTSELEKALCACADSCPVSQRRLADHLAELGF